jgi:hypothetical protein
LHGNLDERLLVVTVGITPADILIRGLVKVSLNMMESVLGDVSNTSIRVLPGITSLRDNLTGEDLDHGRLTSTILTDTTNARAHGDLDRDIKEGGDSVTGVGKVSVYKLHESLGLGLNTLDRPGLRELELEL